MTSARWFTVTWHFGKVPSARRMNTTGTMVSIAGDLFMVCGFVLPVILLKTALW